ncbi:RDD family protein [Acinetobacter sp. 194]|uniref:RDD family protein n=1 Tax=Acinetobacter shaoyimingii TaxID=2715164 RepID=UPI00140D5EDE|nr:RDD family protein [Acinetobacter shaoyimingii]NHB57146.1 RDD family protein [Acinetobacter shaoyimingii]
MQIYLARNNQQAGPYDLEQLNQMLASQQVLLTDLVWHQGMQEWKALGELTQGQLYYQPKLSTSSEENNAETQSGAVTSTYQNPSIQNISVEKKQQKVELASIGSRFLAKLIDLALWLPATYLLTAFFTPEQEIKFTQLNEQFTQTILNQTGNTALAEQLQNQILQLIPQQAIFAALAYLLIMLGVQAFFIAKSGQSIGKKIVKIRIVDATNNQQVSLFRAFTIRSVVFIFFNLILAPFLSIIDFLFILGAKRQTLHDRLAKTIVIKN